MNEFNKIYYRKEKGVLDTYCQVFYDTYVNSIACHNCPNFIANNQSKQFVICGYKEEKQQPIIKEHKMNDYQKRLLARYDEIEYEAKKMLKRLALMRKQIKDGKFEAYNNITNGNLKRSALELRYTLLKITKDRD